MQGQGHKRRFTILGCSSSPGVPRIDGDWGACDPNEPKNRRRRAAFLIEQFAPDGGVTTVVIDTGPDFREQMVSAKVKRLDAVLYTHAHADHLHGIDDLRGYFHAQRQRIPIWANTATMDRIRAGFGYCLETPAGSSYPPILEPHIIHPAEPIQIEGAGGVLEIRAHEQIHGDIISLGFRIGDVAYCSDVSGFPAETLDKLRDLDVLIIDALQYKPHPSHFSLGEAVEWIERLAPRHSYLTHMHVPLDYRRVMEETPGHIEPAYDGLMFEVPWPYTSQQ